MLQLLRVSNYVIGTPLSDERFFVLMHGMTGALDKINSKIGNYLIENRGLEIHKENFEIHNINETTWKILQDRGYITDMTLEKEKSKLIEIATTLHELDLNNSPMRFLFVPTYTCNLRCPYCFQSHDMHAGKGEFGIRMTKDQVDSAFKIIDQMAYPGAIAKELGLVDSKKEINKSYISSSRRLDIGLFGGEPLSEISFPIIPYIVEKAVERKRPLSAITNGVELKKFRNYIGPGLIEDLQITLDGLADLHDKRRIGPHFRKTFDIIVENISMALDKKVRIDLRMNIDRTNINDLESLNEYFNKLGWNKNPNFNPNAAVVDSDSPDPNPTLLQRHELVQFVSNLRKRTASSLSSYESTAMKIVSRCMDGKGYPFRRVANCAAETGMIIFDPLGDIYTCWDEVGEAPNRIGTYTKDGIKFNRELAMQWLTRFPGAIDQCSTCPYALIHTSGCAMHARKMSDTMFASACDSFQEYFPHSLGNCYEELEKGILCDSKIETNKKLPSGN